MDGLSDIDGARRGRRSPARASGSDAPDASGGADVFVVGTVACDTIERVDRLPGADEFCLVRGVERAAGGSAANTAVQLAQLGDRVAFAGAVGDDDAGEAFSRSLREEGVSTEGLVTRRGATTTVTRVTVDREGAHFITLDMGDAFFSLRPSQLDAGAIRSARVLYTDLLPRDAALHALRVARRTGVACVVGVETGMGLMREFGWDDAALLRAMREADIVMASRQALGDLTASDDPRLLMGMLARQGDDAAPLPDGGALPSAILTTMGAAGSRAATREGGLEDVAAVKPPDGARVMDTTGAGDSYLGGFIHARFIEGASLRRAMEFAARCATVNVCHPGARAPREAFARLRAR